MKKALNIIFALLLVAGCQQQEDKLLRLAGKKPPKNAIHEPIYCYKTLAEINCYNAPKKGWENRLVGHFEPPPPPPPPPAAPVKQSKGTSDVGAVPEAAIYDVKVQDIPKPEPKETPVPAIKPLTR